LLPKRFTKYIVTRYNGVSVRFFAAVFAKCSKFALLFSMDIGFGHKHGLLASGSQPVLASDDPGVERTRLLGQASAAKDDETARTLAALARSYEAKASLAGEALN